ncbi:MAG: 30S ribosomal protein S17 [bacterium]|nr:30S ribosomal protein S17 [bacterium]
MKKNSRPKIFRGEIVSRRMDKTAVVLVTRFRKVKKYGKYVKISKRFKAHDEKNEHKVGERVLICETKPLSREKRWKIIQKI